MKIFGLTLLLVAATAFGGTESLEKMPVALETQLALSALPPHLRDQATVYLLDPSTGYVKSRAGTNGFTCFVARTDYLGTSGGAWPVYRNDILIPISYDAEGTKSILPVWFDVASLRAKGLSVDEMKKEIAGRFANGTYRSPARPGISYMLAPLLRTYLGPQSTEVMSMNIPHYMFYAPGLSNADIGGVPPSPTNMHPEYPFVNNPGPHSYIIKTAGDSERAAINQQQADLLQALCHYRSEFCLPAEPGHHH